MNGAQLLLRMSNPMHADRNTRDGRHLDVSWFLLDTSYNENRAGIEKSCEKSTQYPGDLHGRKHERNPLL
jgi:hypothetical protein